MVENLTCLSALERRILKSNQNDVMDEELVQNDVMDEKFVQIGVMDGKIVPKVVIHIRGWNSLQPSNQNLLEEFIDKNEPLLLIGIRSRDPFLVT